MSSVDGNSAAAVLSPSGMFGPGNERRKEVDINNFHVSPVTAHLGVLKATAQQHGICLVGKLAPSSVCSQAKGIPVAPPYHTTARTRAPMELIAIDTAEPYQESLRGSRCVIILVGGASRLQRPYGTRDTSAPAIFAVVKRFVVEMGVLGAFLADHGSEYNNRTFTEYCDGVGIHRELTAPFMPQ